MKRTLIMILLCGLVMAAGATTAEAITVRGTLRYLDGDGQPAPIRRARVDVRVFRGRPLIWRWETEASVVTNDSGFFSVEMPFFASDVRYALHVYATNPAAQVFTPDFYTIPFYREPGAPGPQTELVASWSGAILTFDNLFTDLWATRPFNIADSILRAADYANARRDPRQTDVNTRVDVLLNSVGSTYYDPVVHAIRMDAGIYGMDDFTIIHEYGHRLEEQLSSFFGIAAVHDGCRADAGVSYVSPGYAWMEGFASYFAEAVARDAGIDAAGLPLVDGPRLGTMGPGTMESPSCPGATASTMSLEVFVAGALFDMLDANTPGEMFDGMCTARTGLDTDTLIFQIFDHELDIGWTNPTLQQFVDAWRARGLDLPPLVSTFGQSALFPAVPGSVIRYDADLARHNLAVWRPGANSVWHVIGSASGGVFTWGTTGDRPVPADYDGDGFTDLAVWRPGDGNWFIKLSASGVDQVAQWGLAGDIPLPGDYDGDGEADLAVYRPSNGVVFIHGDECAGERTVVIGAGSNTPVVGDFDGDSVDEPGLYDPASGWFWIRRANGTYIFYNMGATGGQPVVADYDGDHKSDAATYDSTTGNWRVRSSTTGAITVTWWGAFGEIPVPGDYDGDNRADLVTWSTIDGMWWLKEADGPTWNFQWGTAGDIPVAAP